MARKHSPLRERPLAFIDIETTGLDPQIHEIIEFAALVVYPRQSSLVAQGSKTMSIRIKPKNIETASPRALEINGYNPTDWEYASELEEVLPQIRDFLEGSILVGHNVRFDKGFLDEAFKKAGIKNTLPYHLVDTVTLAYEHLVPCGLERLSLANICDFLGISNDGAHQAMIDVLRCKQVYDRLTQATWWDRLGWKRRGRRPV